MPYVGTYPSVSSCSKNSRDLTTPQTYNMLETEWAPQAQWVNNLTMLRWNKHEKEKGDKGDEITV